MKLFKKCTEREDLSKKSDIPCYCIERLNVIKDFISIEKCICKINASPIKPPTEFFMKLNKLCVCICVCVFIFREQRVMLLKKIKVGAGR